MALKLLPSICKVIVQSVHTSYELKMNPKLVFFLFSLYLLGGCQNEETTPTCDLRQSDLIGTWEIQSLTIDGISSLAIVCCQFLELQEDGQAQDCQGGFIYSDAQNLINQGSFVLAPSSLSISFNTGSRQFTYAYQVQNEQLTFIYQEDGAEFVETWARIN